MGNGDSAQIFKRLITITVHLMPYVYGKAKSSFGNCWILEIEWDVIIDELFCLIYISFTLSNRRELFTIFTRAQGRVVWGSKSLPVFQNCSLLLQRHLFIYSLLIDTHFCTLVGKILSCETWFSAWVYFNIWALYFSGQESGESVSAHQAQAGIHGHRFITDPG